MGTTTSSNIINDDNLNELIDKLNKRNDSGELNKLRERMIKDYPSIENEINNLFNDYSYFHIYNFLNINRGLSTCQEIDKLPELLKILIKNECLI
jgi:hypothetical protein